MARFDKDNVLHTLDTDIVDLFKRHNLEVYEIIVSENGWLVRAKAKQNAKKDNF